MERKVEDGMERYKRQIPDGVQDTLPAECYHKKQVRQALEQQFALYGYQELESPMFEYYDVFINGIGQVRQEQMMKMVDSQGHILVLRSDMTIPMARIAATRMRQEVYPLRLCQFGSAFGYDFALSGRAREFFQADAELYGMSGPEADAEVIALAAKALEAAGLTDYQLDIGQVEFFKGLMEEAGLSADQVEELSGYVEQKNSLAMELLLRNTSVGRQVRERIMRLPSFYGGEEVLQVADKLSAHPRCKSAIRNLRQICEILKDYGLGPRISIDLGMVHGIDYYTGMIFRGITQQLGYPIVTGGRYDHLVRDFGLELPATGFAVSIKGILIALERADRLAAMPALDMVVGFAPECRKAAWERMQGLREQGLRVESFSGSIEDCWRHVTIRKPRQAVFIGPEREQEINSQSMEGRR